MINEERLKEICDNHYNDVYRYCFSRVHNVHDAKDITQEVFKLFLEKAPKLEDKNLKAWLYDVALIKIKESCKEQKSTSKIVSLDDDDNLHSIEVRTAYTLDEEVLFSNLDDEDIYYEKEKILSQLTAEEKELYNEIFINKKKYKDVASEKGMTTKAINVRAFRLKQKLKEFIKSSTTLLIMFLFFKFLK